MHKITFLLVSLIVLYIIFYYKKYYEHFYVFDYEFPLSNVLINDTCPIKGSIEEIDNPSMGSCYRGYYIPYILDVGTYQSEVQPQM